MEGRGAGLLAKTSFDCLSEPMAQCDHFLKQPSLSIAPRLHHPRVRSPEKSERQLKAAAEEFRLPGFGICHTDQARSFL